MSIMGGGIQPRLPEHLLLKGDQNKDTSLQLGRIIVVAKYINQSCKSEKISGLIDYIENQQMVIGGKSRIKYADVIKSWNEQNSFKPIENKK